MIRRVLSRLGKEIPAALEETILNAALSALARQEAGGFGQLGNGRYKVGAPIRITASGLAQDLAIPGVPYPDVEAVLDRHFVAKREGNKVFYSL